MKGRKCKQESRAGEIRQKLVAWKQTPVSSRQSLRALARELGTSHQLLNHYLAGLKRWEYKELYRNAEKEAEGIRGRAKTENRALTAWEEQQLRELDRAAGSALIGPALLDSFEEIKQAAKRGPLHWAHFKMLQIFAKQGFPEGAQELLSQCWMRPRIIEHGSGKVFGWKYQKPRAKGAHLLIQVMDMDLIDRIRTCSKCGGPIRSCTITTITITESSWCRTIRSCRR